MGAVEAGRRPAGRGAGGLELWPVGRALAVCFAAAVAGLGVLGWVALALLGFPRLAREPVVSLHDLVGVLQLVFASVAGVGKVRFADAVFAAGEVQFNWARFTGADVTFYGARFCGGTVRFDWVTVSAGVISFIRAGFSGGAVTFREAGLSAGQLRFDQAEFTGGTVGFAGARFAGTDVRFEGAVFAGGTADFGQAADWSHPPAFDWAGTPPPGVILP